MTGSSETTDIWAVISSLFTALGVIVGAALVAYQLRCQRRWHIQHSTLEMATRFVEGDLFKQWVKIREAMAKPTRREAITLTGDDKEALLALLSYFETIGVMHEHDILDVAIVKSAFSSAIVELHEYSKEFIVQYRKERGNNLIYIAFEKLVGTLRPVVERERKETEAALSAA